VNAAREGELAGLFDLGLHDFSLSFVSSH
jgi:hypothetical protein